MQFPWRPRKNANSRGTSGGHGRGNSRPNTNLGVPFGVIRKPAGPNSHRPFSHRGKRHIPGGSQVDNADPFASDDEFPLADSQQATSTQSIPSLFGKVSRSSDRNPHRNRESHRTASTQSIPSLLANLSLHDNAHSTRGRSTEDWRQNRKYDNAGKNQRYSRNVDRDSNRHRYNNENREDGEVNENKFRGRKYPLGFKKLEEILNNSPEEVSLKLLENQEALSLLIDKPDLSPDYICLIVQIITKVSDTSFEQSKLKILHIVTDESFIRQLLAFITQLPLQDERDKRRAKHFWDNPSRFFTDVNVFCETVLKVLPSKAIDALPKLLKGSLLIIPHLNLSDEIYASYENLNQKLLTTIEELQKRNENKKARNVVDIELEPPDDFRAINVFPQPMEIVVRNAPFLRKNVVDGAYRDVDHYLDVQFRLVRNDFVKPLQDGICTYLQKDSKKRAQNIKIYNGVNFLKSEMCSNATNCYLIQLPKPKKGFQMKLENSRMFMFGSLVCFTKDDFRSIIFGRIVDRKIELLKEGRLIVSLLSNTENIDLLSNYIMIESKVYFEPYYYVLTALQQIREDEFPMREFIVDMEPDAGIPNYYRGNTIQLPGKYRIPILNGVVYESQWPTERQLELNAAQYAAYKNAVSRKFAIIQGPPGTGKTHLGLKVAKSLLFNADIWHKGESPMLVICFTNHALDQFLEGLLTTTTELIRIGGQSKNTALDKFNLRYVRNRSHNYLIHKEQFAVRQSAEALKKFYDLLEATRAYNGIVNIKPLLHELPDLNNTIFSNIQSEDFTKWLLGGTVHQNVNLLDVSKYVAQNKTDPVANQEEAEDQSLLEELMEMFENEYSIEDDVFNVNFTGASPYIITINNYKTNMQQLEEEAKKLNSLGDEADPREWQRLQSRYEQIKFEHDYLEKVLEEGKNIVNPQPLKDMARRLKNPQDLLPQERWQLYFHWIKEYEAQILKSLAEEEASYQRVYQEYEEVRMMADLKLLKEKKVIGMTTTGAARLQSLLRALRSRVVIIEEAAEIMEAHIITALTKHCEHVILIGDHQQLRPSTADFTMETKYDLGISLFERMIRNKVHCNVLEIQHRMKPEISKLIVPTIYPVLHDHESVHQFPPVKGVARNLYFIHHTNFESLEKDDSKYNIHEVHYLLHLAQYLLLNGYKPQDITILCAYSAQLFKMFAERKKFERLRDIRICVLDNYQGEESKIILLSLVRNNDKGSIGFLKIENRICVALSRAREGFYIMGNMDLLTQVSEIWQKIKETLRQQGNIGESLPLICQVHVEKITPIKTINDFYKVSEGGCDQICNTLLKCGHICKSQCHVNNRDHSKSTCRERCLNIICEEEHVCPKMCFEECGDCLVPMLRNLECGHQGTYPCFDKKPNCREIVPAKLPCGHETKKMCFVDVMDVRCPHPCDTRLEICGHACVLKCHIFKDPDHLQYRCQKKCGKIRPKCMMNTDDHRCTKFCSEECDECDIVYRKVRSCGHAYSLKCSMSVELYECDKPCRKMLPCGHKCKLACNEPCGNCLVKVDKEVPGCGHTINIFCKDTPTKSVCTRSCPLKLPCGHLCQKKCKDICTTKCKNLVRSVLPLGCGHVTEIPCYLNDAGSIASDLSLLKYCKAPCNKTLKCDHNCSGTCGECYQGRIHKACASDCGVTLICGHVCKTPCRQVCPPCMQPCEFRCAHSKCKKRCGEPCTPCQEKCARHCKHQACQRICNEICSVDPCEEPCPRKLRCGHNCIGFCGDPCPPLCRVCNYEEVTEFFLGYEDEDDARFVLLEDCKHVIESHGMDMWLNSSSDEINMKCCPKCKQTLANTQRYSDYVKKALNNIVAVKRKYYGSFQKNVADGRLYMEELQAFYGTTKLKVVCPIVKTLYDTFSSQLKPQKEGKRQMLSKLMVETTHAKIQVLQSICEMYDDTFKTTNLLPKKCFDYLAFLLGRLTAENERMTEQEIDDYEVELKRLRRILQFSFVSMRLSMTSSVRNDLTNIENKLYHNGPYDVKDDTQIKVKITTLSQAIGGLDVSESELKAIVKVIGVRSGAWYKCPNGHPYAIGDCGGAMVEAKCADCGAPIGGQNHQLTRGNAHFGIDGSSHSAWSEQANMGNYGFNF